MNLNPTVLLAILFSPLVAFFFQVLAGRRLFGGTPYLDPAEAPHDAHVSENRLLGALIPILGVLLPLVLVVLFVVPSLTKPTDPYFLPETGEGALWIDFGERALRIGLQVDNTSKVLVFMVTLVCSMIHIFAAAYMKTRDGIPEPRYTRFFAYLSLFTFSMLLLSLSDNLLTLFIGWELMGLCSYLLIGFYYEKRSACDASLKAFMTTRVGDVLLFLSLAMIWTKVGSLRFEDIYAGIQSGKLSGGLLTAAGLLAFGGAIGKSAQFPLHTWLPDAMEGPTPVSALIHAATMVAAGVYLSARLLQIGVLDASATLFVAYIGAFTAVFAASIAFVQNDIKKVLAYSTISQLGYMTLAVGVGNYTAAMFHLLTHAFFKACLFLGSGSVIHAMHEGLHRVHAHADAQDLRNMGGLRQRMPLTFATFLVSTLAISGIPLTAGFLSKDAILAGSLAFALERPEHSMLPLLGFAAAMMTAFYMFRLVLMAFFGEPAERAEEAHRAEIAEAHRHLHESPALMTVPLVVLAIFALGFVWSLNPFAEGWIGEVATKQEGWMIGPVPEHAENDHADSEHAVHNLAMGLSLGVAGVGILLAILVYGTRSLRVERLATSPFAEILRRKYGFDELYDYLFVRNLLRINRVAAAFDNSIVDGAVNGIARALASGRYSFTWFSGAVDRYVVDGAVNGIAYVLRGLGAAFRRLQTGMLNSYLLVVFTGVVALIFIFSALIR